ncbi:MAG: hypothetical protein JSR40_12385, partial [Proteobacteria bacterium]|nr:hypothetical protein [Pseudomonadota bacterium]
RVAARAAQGGDASEADVAVLDMQLAQREPLSDDERATTLAVDTAAAVSWPSLLPALDALVARQSARFGHSGGGL